jgi:thiamine kinase-like enzyme
LQSVAKAVDSWPGYAERYSRKLRAMADVILERIVQITRRDDNAFNVLTHSDLWVNNILFRYSEIPEDLRFVDFQLLYFSSPVIDLQYFFSTSLCEEVREYHLDRLMEVKLILIVEIKK